MAMAKALRRDRWIVGNEEDGTNLYALGLYTPMFIVDFPRLAQAPPCYHVFEFKGGHMRWLVPENHSLAIARLLLERVLRRPNYFGEIRQKLARICHQAYAFGRQVLRLKVGTISDARLLSLLMRFQKLQRTIIAYGMISTLVEIPHSQFVKHLENFLADHVSKISAPPGAPEYFSILSAIPEESRQRQEAKSLLRLLQTVKKSKKLFNAVASLKPGEGSKKFLRPPGDPAMLSFYRQLNYHVKEFCWAYYGYEGPAYGIDRPLSELAQLLSDKVDPAAELKRLARERAQIRPATKIAERTLKLSAYERALFQALRDTVFMKLYRKDAMTFGFYSAESLLKELARRAGIALAAAKCLAPGEYARALRQDKKLIAELYRRIPYAVYAADSLKPRVLSGSRARRFIKSIYREEAVGDVRELKGQVACLGHATGAVKIINVAAEMGKMNKGDILVSIATIPDIVPAMKKAAAIVTEQGGITSHAAIVSRELGVPCVIGTKIATKVFKDGDLVEVDAIEGIVYKLK